MNDYPDWVEKQRQKNTQIVRIRDNYYLYKIKSVWDKKIQRARKITEKYLGKITPDGVIKPKHERVNSTAISVKEFGASNFVFGRNEDLINLLKDIYPQYWKEIMCFAFFRLFKTSPLKNLETHFESSCLSEIFPDAKMSPKGASALLNFLGKNRGFAIEFMQRYSPGTKHQIIDLTHIFSSSENLSFATIGRKSNIEYTPQINAILLFSIEKNAPSFYRLVPGSISDVSTIPVTLQEAGINNAVFIGDKGFYSEKNETFLKEQKLNYVLPIKRNNILIDYSSIKDSSRKGFDGHFFFEERVIWYKTKKLEENKKLVLFLDERLRAEETKDYLLRAQKNNKPVTEFHEVQEIFGTISVLTNLDDSPNEIFSLLKSRLNIEQLFDTFKNTLHADRTYMQNDDDLQGWFFINFIATLLYYRIFNQLTKEKLIEKYSPADILIHLSRIYKLRISNKWILSEIPRRTKDIAAKLNYVPPIT